MPRSIQLALLLLFPIAVIGASYLAWVVIAGAMDAGGRPIGPRYDYVVRIQLPPVDREISLPPVAGPADASRPLVVLDPGHGGHDPGARQGRLDESQVTLRIAREVRDRLVADGGIRVALTRGDDRYLTLAERSGIARRLGADLFVSIHADAAESPDARGASVYVLSDKGSSQAAARIAARENAADTVNGVRLEETSDAVTAILLDLSQSEAQEGSYQMARLILRELEGKAPTHYSTVQSAAFGVLKAPDVPSVLFETGYITNPADTAYLVSPTGREVLAEATARAVRAFFARRSEAAP
ncbi:MAG TPA: N-acetylmuramoyl-L-alanine amidase [Novosphingobium sp.]|nr:N-acetylmuramoyl-L-alanine amidase [Novosphingobium sp.]